MCSGRYVTKISEIFYVSFRVGDIDKYKHPTEAFFFIRVKATVYIEQPNEMSELRHIIEQYRCNNLGLQWLSSHKTVSKFVDAINSKFEKMFIQY